MCSRVVFAGTAIVAIATGVPGCYVVLEPIEDVLPEIRLVVVHEYGCGDMHRGDENHSVVDVGRGATFFDALGNVDDLLALLRVKGEIISMGLHDGPFAVEGGWHFTPPVSFVTKPSCQPARKRCP